MTEDVLVHLLRQMMWITSLLIMPPLLIALVVGLLIGLLQAVTSIQEQTLTFVPKIAGVVLIYIVLGGWMARLLVDYCAELFLGLPEFGAL